MRYTTSFLSLSSVVLILSVTLVGCEPASAPLTDTPTPAVTSATAIPVEVVSTVAPVKAVQPGTCKSAKEVADPAYKDPSVCVNDRVEDLLARMTPVEKIGQMTQVENYSLTPEDVTTYFIGSVLSGGGGATPTNSAAEWLDLTNSYAAAATQTRLGIPLIYGIDAVHGHGHIDGAVIFPHNIGLGAANDLDLNERIGRVTAQEMAATGIYWNFAPCVTVPQDIRWGRTYEGYSENTDIVSNLGAAYLKGLQTVPEDWPYPLWVIGDPKHFVGDGGTKWGTSTVFNKMLDQGVTDVDEATLRAVHLPPYQQAVKNGAVAIMVSFSSWDGQKMHAQKYLLTDVLKGELGFKGFLVSDWGGIDQISPDYYTAIVTSINAGVDMNMVPQDFRRFIDTLTKAVARGDVSQARIDDAVRRILWVKFMQGLFERSVMDESLLDSVGSPEHRALGREAVRKSLVLLKNENNALPIAKDTPLIFVAGARADDVGSQCGGWTITWQGQTGATITGTSIFEAVQGAVQERATVEYSAYGQFKATDHDGKPAVAAVGIVVVGEEPYAEGPGDTNDLSLSGREVKLIEKMRAQSKKLVVVLLSGRPMIITEQLPLADAFVAAWLPGTEGAGITDVLFGDYPFTGKLSYTWPRSMAQLPFDFKNLPTTGCASPLFSRGYGLDTSGSGQVDWRGCPPATVK